jgi:bifunctional non-homologous end joining protein LigD
MAAQLVEKLPEGPQWLYEIKLDGYRAFLVKNGTDVRFISRNNKDLTKDFPSLLKAAAGVRPASVLIDGEIVAVDEKGRPRFQLLQHRSTTAKSQIVYYAFDLLSLDGEDLTALPLEERRRRLAPVISGSGVFHSEPLEGSVASIIEAATALELEGVIAKRRDSRYEPGRRSGAWQKFRLRINQEFVVGGFSPGSPFDSILVGYYEKKKLMFCGRVRAGFTASTRRQLYGQLKPLIVAECLFTNLPNRKSGGWNEGVTAEEMATMIWVKPQVVVQVAFVEWTTYDLLRHSSFLGLRTDKRASTVIRDQPKRA